MNWTEVAPKILQIADQGASFPWPRSAGSRDALVRSLSYIIPDQDYDLLYPLDERAVANRNLRQLISPLLRGNDPAVAETLAAWVVRDWGGIRRGVDETRIWSSELQAYSSEAVAKFIDRMGTRRISSWSKLLAFALPDQHAIYDARTSVAINCALAQIGIDKGFFMPMGRNQTIGPAHMKLALEGFGVSYGYREYIRLLEAMARLSTSSDILAMEMLLFANAPLIAMNYCNT